MKRADWFFLATAAAVAVAIWYFFIRRGAQFGVGSTGALLGQDHILGNGTVEPDASGFAAGHYDIDYSGLS